MNSVKSLLSSASNKIKEAQIPQFNVTISEYSSNMLSRVAVTPRNIPAFVIPGTAGGSGTGSDHGGSDVDVSRATSPSGGLRTAGQQPHNMTNSLSHGHLPPPHDAAEYQTGSMSQPPSPREAGGSPHSLGSIEEVNPATGDGVCGQNMLSPPQSPGVLPRSSSFASSTDSHDSLDSESSGGPPSKGNAAASRPRVLPVKKFSIQVQPSSTSIKSQTHLLVRKATWSHPQHARDMSNRSPSPTHLAAAVDTNKSPASSPMAGHSGSVPAVKAQSHSRKGTRKNRMYSRRRSSLTDHTLEQFRAKHPNLLLGDSTDSDISPFQDRKISEGAGPGATLLACDRLNAESHGGGEPALAVPRGRSMSAVCNPTIVREDAVTDGKRTVARYGELKLSLLYIDEFDHLKVQVIRAENLGGMSKSCVREQEMEVYVKLYLLPGKQQKQASKPVKGTRNPAFLDVFCFQHMKKNLGHDSKLRIKVFNKCRQLRRVTRDDFLGEVQIQLDCLDMTQECRMWKDVKPRIDAEELGHLQVVLKYEPHRASITVTILKAQDLPKHHLTGSPDAYIKVASYLEGIEQQRFQSKVKKKTTAPLFKESFQVPISIKGNDLSYTTVTLTVLGHETIRSDYVIGQVRLGYGATEDSEIEHWNLIMQNPGLDFTEWHSIMEYDEEI